MFFFQGMPASAQLLVLTWRMLVVARVQRQQPSTVFKDFHGVASTFEEPVLGRLLGPVEAGERLFPPATYSAYPHVSTRPLKEPLGYFVLALLASVVGSSLPISNALVNAVVALL